MTLGAKIRAARTRAGMTQQQLADTLHVSRQAITKWETDAGIPDIDNLKALGALFDVSVDHLVGGDQPVGRVLREPVDLAAFRPRRRSRLLAVQARYPDAVAIEELLRTVKRSRLAWLVEAVLPFDFLRAVDSVDHYAAYYLVDLGDRQLLVTVTRTEMISRELPQRWDGRGVLELGDQKYWRAQDTLRVGPTL